MKTWKPISLLLLFCVFSIFSLTVFSQNNIQFNINHKLGETDFAFETATTNNIDHSFHVQRLEYYISEISIVHDGGIETAIDELWILANASEPTNVDLGMHDIETVETVYFHIGVDPGHNHRDPAGYDISHPLAPKSPSMHWGWTGGYRFVALEGFSGSNLDQQMQIHGLGDNNYFKVEIPLSAAALDGTININIDADYTRALENIELNAGLVEHSEQNEAKQTLENFRDYVFKASTDIVALENIDLVFLDMTISPNPASISNTISVNWNNVNTLDSKTYELIVFDILGRKMQQNSNINNGINDDSTISLEFGNSQLSPGLYFVNLVQDGQIIASQKLVVE